MGRLDTKITIALGKSVFKNTISQKTTTIRKLFEKLETPILSEKKDNSYFVFASFKENIRNAQNVDQFYGATIDLDDTTLTLKEIRKIVSKYIHCVYTTHSHKAKGKGDRYRLVLPYKKPVDLPTHSETMLYLMHLLGGKKNVDLSSKAISRPMYLPACPKEREEHFEFYSKEIGFLFNPMAESVREEVAALHFENFESGAFQEPVNIGKDVDEGGRNDTLARAIGKWIKDGVAREDLYSFAESYNLSKFHPPLSTKEVKTVVDSIIKAHTRNSDDLDWGYDEIASRVKNAKDLSSIYDHIIDMIVAAKKKNKLSKSKIELLKLEINKKTKLTKTAIESDIKAKEYEAFDIEVEEQAVNLEDQLTHLKKEVRDWVFVASDDRFYNTKTGEYYKREAFASVYASPNVEGSLVALLMKYKLIKHVSRREFDPSRDGIYTRDLIRYVNTYIPPDIFPLPGNVSFIMKHFRYLLPNKYERDIVLDFIAHLVQNPGEKVRWMPIIKGSKGIGKTIIAEKIIMPLIGFNNFSKVSNDLIKSDFNSWQTDCQLIVFEELDIGANFKEKQQLTDKLKSFITDDLMMAHRKGLDPYQTINKANSMGFTNEDDAIVITPDERRFCMIRTDAKPKDQFYYRKLRHEAETKLQELYHYFLTRDITGFNNLTAPDTAYTQEVKNYSLEWPASAIAQLLSGDMDIKEKGFISTLQVVDYIRKVSTGKYAHYSDDLLSQGSRSSKKLTYSLRNMGFSIVQNPGRSDGRFKMSGKLTAVWKFPGQEDMDIKYINKALGEIDLSGEDWDD